MIQYLMKKYALTQQGAKDFLKATEIGFFYNQYIDEIYRTPKNIEIINLTYRILEYILVMV